MDITAIARVAHEVNRAYCLALGDKSQPAWEDAPDWQRSSAIAGVVFHLRNPNADASASHESWMRQKLEDGWTYGPTKIPALKQHPCIVPFEQLPREQQAKDFIFRAVVHALRGEIMSTDQQIEQEIQVKGLTAPRVTPADIEANIAEEYYVTAASALKGTPGESSPPLKLLTFCILVLKNGFTVTGESAARQNAVQKMWPLMGYHLRQMLHEQELQKRPPYSPPYTTDVP